MKNYIVHMKEVWDQPVRVGAENEEDAITAARNALERDLRSRFECRLSSSLWTVEEIE